MGRVPKRTSNRNSQASELSIVVTQLTEEVRILRMAVDELRDDVVWAARQVLATGYEVSGQMPQRPRDPLAPDADCFPVGALKQEQSDETLYCCNSPRLTWHGSPEAPGVACANCGYLIAEEGQVVIWRHEEGTSSRTECPDDDASAEPQGRLFD
jgi:hypothetical protein